MKRPMIAAVLLALPLSAAAVDTGATEVPLDDEGEVVAQQPRAATAAGATPFQEGTLGLSFTLGGSGLNFWGTTGIVAGPGIATQVPSVGVIWFMDQTSALVVDVGLVLGIRPDFDLNMEVGLGYRYYFAGLSGRVGPFVQPGVVIGWVGESIHLGLVGQLGVEYFFTDQLALGGTLGLRLLMLRDLDRIGFVTSTSGLHLTFYW
jgi:hypothetical protein